MQCMKIVTTSVSLDTSEKNVLTEEYRCDLTHLCKPDLDRSCTLHTNSIIGNKSIEVETCCCQDSECYHPAHRNPSHGTVLHKSGSSPMQRTLVIVIGVALGILVVGVTIFFVRKSVRNSRQKHSGKSKNYSTTVFRAISKSDNEALEDDKVQILATS